MAAIEQCWGDDSSSGGGGGGRIVNSMIAKTLKHIIIFSFFIFIRLCFGGRARQRETEPVIVYLRLAFVQGLKDLLFLLRT